MYDLTFSLQDALSQLTEMGFSDTRAKKALLINKYVEAVKSGYIDKLRKIPI